MLSALKDMMPLGSGRLVAVRKIGNRNSGSYVISGDGASLPSLVPPKGTGEAPCRPPVRGFSMRAPTRSMCIDLVQTTFKKKPRQGTVGAVDWGSVNKPYCH